MWTHCKFLGWKYIKTMENTRTFKKEYKKMGSSNNNRLEKGEENERDQMSKM